MTLTNICLLAICFGAMWMLKEAAQAEPVAVPANRSPWDGPSPTDVDTLVASGVLTSPSRAETPWAADLQGTSVFEDTEPQPQYDGAPRDFASAFSSTPSGMLSPLNPGGVFTSEPAGQGGITQGVNVRLPFLGARRQGGFVQQAGPLALDLYAITFTALYSDLKMANSRADSDGGFLAAVSLQGALTLELGECAYVGVGFNIYYLPTVNRVGFYFGNGGAATAATFRYEWESGGWQFTVGDDFRVFNPVGDLLADYEVDEIATAGRYRFGRPESLGDRSYFSEDIFFSNVASIAAARRVNDEWMFRAQGGYVNMWSSSGSGLSNNGIFARAGLYYDSPGAWFLPWLAYDFRSLDRQDQQAHQITAGTSLLFTPAFRGYVRLGWVDLETEGASSRQKYLWELGVTHHINENLAHSLFGGQNYFVTDYGDPFLGSYGRYTLTWHPSASNWSFSASAQTEHNDLVDASGVTYQGRAVLAIDERTSLEFFAASARYDRTAAVFDRQIYGTVLSHRFSPTVRGSLSYQHSDYRTTSGRSDYTEHLFYISVTKSL